MPNTEDARVFWWGALMGALAASSEAIGRAREAITHLRQLGFEESGTPFPAAAGNWGQVSEPFAIAAGPEVPDSNRSGSTVTARSFCQCDRDQQLAQFTRDGVWICAHCDQPRRPRGVTP